MIPQNALQTLRDREVEIRSTSEDERRRKGNEIEWAAQGSQCSGEIGK